LSTSERMQPTLPGVEELATESRGMQDEDISGDAVSAGGPIDGRDAGRTGSPGRTGDPDPGASRATGGQSTTGAAGSTGNRAPRTQPLVRAEQRDAPYCYQCGNAMQRAGSCYVCGSCGTTSGCS